MYCLSFAALVYVPGYESLLRIDTKRNTQNYNNNNFDNTFMDTLKAAISAIPFSGQIRSHCLRTEFSWKRVKWISIANSNQIKSALTPKNVLSPRPTDKRDFLVGGSILIVSFMSFSSSGNLCFLFIADACTTAETHDDKSSGSGVAVILAILEFVFRCDLPNGISISSVGSIMQHIHKQPIDVNATKEFCAFVNGCGGMQYSLMWVALRMFYSF